MNYTQFKESNQAAFDDMILFCAFNNNDLNTKLDTFGLTKNDIIHIGGGAFTTHKKYTDFKNQDFNGKKKEKLENLTFFKNAVSEELANHEACVTCDYTEALEALNLKYDCLSNAQKTILKEELKRQINNYL